MEGNKAFFGKEGLTSSSASHYCKIAHEMSRTLTAQIESVSFINSTITMPMANDHSELATAVGYDLKDLACIEDNIEIIGGLHAFIAWCNEAIAARELMRKQHNGVLFNEWLKQSDITLTEPKFDTELQRPIFKSKLTSPVIPLIISDAEATKYRELHGTRMPNRISNYDVIMDMDTKERNHFYSLQSKVSLYGKYIGVHNNNDGAFLKARKEMLEKTTHEYSVKGSGSDTIITHYKSSVPIESVEETYFRMQKKHRALQAELNGIIHKIEIEAQHQYDEMRAEYQKNLSIYKKEHDKELQEYEKEVEKYEAALSREREEFQKQLDAYHIAFDKYTDEYNKWMRDGNIEIQNLRIVIPNALYPIFKRIQEQTDKK